MAASSHRARVPKATKTRPRKHLTIPIPSANFAGNNCPLSGWNASIEIQIIQIQLDANRNLSESPARSVWHCIVWAECIDSQLLWPNQSVKTRLVLTPATSAVEASVSLGSLLRAFKLGEASPVHSFLWDMPLTTKWNTINQLNFIRVKKTTTDLRLLTIIFQLIN